MSDEPPIDDALEQLAKAETPAALVSAHQTLAKTIRGRRGKFRREYGNLAKTYMAAMEIWDGQKADGVPIAARLADLEKTLRVAWPQGREEPWHALCTSCDEYGLVMTMCPGDATCGENPATHRPRKPHAPHEFGRPCWCERGRAFKDKPKPTGEDFTEAGKSRPMTRMGRR